MRLYHFTAKHMADKIRNEGLSIGGIALNKDGNLEVLETYIWLTKNPEWSQPWCHEQILVKYDRTAVRMDVNIPIVLRDKLKPWERVKSSFLKKGYFLLPDFETYGDPQNWFIFKGKIAARYLSNFTNKNKS